MRILGLDYGAKTVGVAISDPLGITAQGLETIVRKEENKLRKTCARIEELIEEYGVSAIILGYPKHMNNTVGERAEKTMEFQVMLERRTGISVILWDERFSTASSERVLMESGVRRENRKAVIDKIAAVFILQNYLDFRSTAKEGVNADAKEGVNADAEEENHE
ncbi:MAG: Holliday junction resolvase RuvX [Lachnospiraceae bacterium]|nr:Holliday junction resolvase RuvX [Lachnospiraceae bacterium]